MEDVAVAVESKSTALCAFRPEQSALLVVIPDNMSSEIPPSRQDNLSDPSSLPLFCQRNEWVKRIHRTSQPCT